MALITSQDVQARFPKLWQELRNYIKPKNGNKKILKLAI